MNTKFKYLPLLIILLLSYTTATAQSNTDNRARHTAQTRGYEYATPFRNFVGRGSMTDPSKTLFYASYNWANVGSYSHRHSLYKHIFGNNKTIHLLVESQDPMNQPDQIAYGVFEFIGYRHIQRRGQTHTYPAFKYIGPFIEP